MLFLPETFANNLLVGRTIILRKLTGNQNLPCEAELQEEDMSANDIAIMSLVRPFTLDLPDGKGRWILLYSSASDRDADSQDQKSCSLSICTFISYMVFSTCGSRAL